MEYLIKSSLVSMWDFQQNANANHGFRIYKQRIKEIFIDKPLIQVDGKG